MTCDASSVNVDTILTPVIPCLGVSVQDSLPRTRSLPAWDGLPSHTSIQPGDSIATTDTLQRDAHVSVCALFLMIYMVYTCSITSCKCILCNRYMCIHISIIVIIINIYIYIYICIITIIIIIIIIIIILLLKNTYNYYY